jgi:hypothetical protein
MKSELSVVLTTSVDSDSQTFEIWQNEIAICEIGLLNGSLILSLCEQGFNYPLLLRDFMQRLEEIASKFDS